MQLAEFVHPVYGRGFMPDLIFVRIHAMPCVNRCWHCFCNGSPAGSFMDETVVLSVLDHLVELREKTGVKVFPMFYDEPTLHRGFLNIMRYQLEMDLIYDGWWFATNGFGLAGLSDEGWADLARMGFSGIRLTFHGLSQEHDRLAGRIGAYDDLVMTIRRAEEYGIEWFAGMVLNAENVSVYEQTKAAIEGMGTLCVEFGWMLPQSQGRAADNRNRVRFHQVFHVTDLVGRKWSTVYLKEHSPG
jgi:molybdenum cofactor biosynthesis enzyme MoaA